jgi:hypothetical protein
MRWTVLFMVLLLGIGSVAASDWTIDGYSVLTNNSNIPMAKIINLVSLHDYFNNTFQNKSDMGGYASADYTNTSFIRYVNATTCSSGYYSRWNGSHFECYQDTKIEELYDVSISGLQNNNLLFYNSTSKLWENKAIGSSDIDMRGNNITGSPTVFKEVTYVVKIDSGVTYGVNGTSGKIDFSNATVNGSAYVINDVITQMNNS